MIETMERIAACIVCAALFVIMTLKTLGVMQQTGYKNRAFIKWLLKKENMLFNRLCVLALCLALASTITALCFSFLGVQAALLCSAIPFVALLLGYAYSDSKLALKVPAVRTARWQRLLAVYGLLVACASYAVIAFLGFLAKVNGSPLYGLIAYIPFAVMPALLPFLLLAANAIIAPFESLHNEKFVKRAGQVLDEKEIIRVGVVGSYGKTSVKNILQTILSEKYSVVATPASYNTPIGVAKTVFSEDFENKQVLIVEMGARKRGDIAKLCALVKPDFAIFTGVCEQHIQSFGSVENAFIEKSEILKSGAAVVCGESLNERIERAFEKEYIDECVIYAGESDVIEKHLQATKTCFTLRLGNEELAVETALLGDAAAENITLAAKLAYECLGLTVEQIASGIKKLQPIAHRLQLITSGGAYILDDGYNCNIVGAEQALKALARFESRTCVVTPGIVEGGVLEEELNARLGEIIFSAGVDKVILVGETLVTAVKKGYLSAGGDGARVLVVPTLEMAQHAVGAWIQQGDCVLFLNDLPDVY